MIVNILLLILIFLRFVIGVRLVLLARQNNLPNIYWLAAQFFVVALGLSFAPIADNPLGNSTASLWIFTIATVFFPPIAIGVFNHTTFHVSRSSPRWQFIAVYIIFAAIGLYALINSESSSNQNPLLAFPNIMIVLAWVWHGWSASQAFGHISKEQAVEDWVKSRYQLITAYAIILIIGTLGTFIRYYFAAGTVITPLGKAMSILTLIAQILGVSLQFLVWVMPAGFRNWLNRNYQTRVQESVNERAATILDIIGSAMSNGTGLSKISALYSIRSSIGREIKTEDSYLIESTIVKYGHDEWLSLLQNPALQKALGNFGNKINNIDEIIDKAKQALTEKQSLFTMQAK